MKKFIGVYMLSFVLFVSNTNAQTLSKIIADDFPNTSEEAFEINFEMDVNGTTETDTDEDWFKFTLSQDDGVIVTLFPSGYYGNNKLYLYEENEALSVYPSSIESEKFDDSKNRQISLNLKSGTYYIKIKRGYDGKESYNYNFNVRIYGAEESNITLDGKTVLYCKEHPIECGITNDIFKYTDEDIDKTKTDTIAYCKDNPSACGIVVSNPITKTDISELNDGWHLLGSSEEIVDLSIFDEVLTVWSWNNGWKAYSPVPDINKTIQSSGTIGTLNKVDAKNGFWIFK